MMNHARLSVVAVALGTAAAAMLLQMRMTAADALLLLAACLTIVGGGTCLCRHVSSRFDGAGWGLVAALGLSASVTIACGVAAMGFLTLIPRAWFLVTIWVMLSTLLAVLLNTGHRRQRSAHVAAWVLLSCVVLIGSPCVMQLDLVNKQVQASDVPPLELLRGPTSGSAQGDDTGTSPELRLQRWQEQLGRWRNPDAASSEREVDAVMAALRGDGDEAIQSCAQVLYHSLDSSSSGRIEAACDCAVAVASMVRVSESAREQARRGFADWTSRHLSLHAAVSQRQASVLRACMCAPGELYGGDWPVWLRDDVGGVVERAATYRICKSSLDMLERVDTTAVPATEGESVIREATRWRSVSDQIVRTPMREVLRRLALLRSSEVCVDVAARTFEDGRVPESLASVGLGAPIDPRTGEPMEYRRVSDYEFCLQSVGALPAGETTIGYCVTVCLASNRTGASTCRFISHGSTARDRTP